MKLGYTDGGMHWSCQTMITTQSVKHSYYEISLGSHLLGGETTIALDDSYSSRIGGQQDRRTEAN